MRFQLMAAALTALASSVAAVPVFSVPTPGGTYAAATAITVTFADDGTQPSISALSGYTLYIAIGGNTAATYEKLELNTGTFTTLTDAITIPASFSGTAANGYFLIMVSTGTDGGTLTSYSDRFSVTGMTGTISSTVKTALASISGTAGPVGVNSGIAVSSTSAAAAEAGSFTVPYYLQTGLIKYAPMQPIPGTTITAKTATPLYPTSAYTLATTYLAPASITLTVTDSQTFSVSSVENTIAAAATRTKDDMGDWLKRWAD